MKKKILRYLNLALLCLSIFLDNTKAQTGVQYRDTLLAGISSNQVLIVFVDTFTTNSLDLTGTPRDLNKWTKSNQSGSPGNPTINTTNTWYTVGSYNNRGYEWGSQAFLRQALNGNQGVYLWTPQITFPNVDNLYLKFILRCAGGFSHSVTSNFTIGWVFDADNNQIPDASPTGHNTTFSSSSDPYGDYTSGNFFPNTMMNARTVNMDISSVKGLTGRIGIRLSQTSSVTNNFDIDWVVIGTRPNNDLCANAIQLAEGYNGGTRGYYNSVATGLIPSTNSSPGNRQGGAVIYVGPAPNGTGAIPSDGTYKDGYEPASPGPFGSTSKTVENSIWFKFITPMASNCASGTLRIRITPKDLSCACNNSSVTPRQLQFRIFNNSVCGSNTNASSIAVSLLSELNNDSPITTDPLSFNTTYYVLVDGVNASDCQFRLQVETLLDNVVQTNPCTVQSPIILPVDFHTLQVNCNSKHNQAELFWKVTDNVVSSFIVENSKDGNEWQFFSEVPNNKNSITIPNQKAIYRLSYINENGEVKYSNVAECNCQNMLETVQIYPSPFQEFFTISNLPWNAQIKVFDSKGVLIYENYSKNDTELIDLKNHATGVYMVIIYYNDQVKHVKIMKTE